MDEDVLRAPLEPLDGASREPLGEALRQREAQVRPALLHVDEAAPAQDGLEAQAYGLDLGKLRHRRLRFRDRPSIPRPRCRPPPPSRRCRRCRRRCPPRRSAALRRRGSSTPPATGISMPPTAWVTAATNCGRWAAMVPSVRDPSPMASAPAALPVAISARLRLVPSSAAKALSAPRASSTATASGLKLFLRAAASAALDDLLRNLELHGLLLYAWATARGGWRPAAAAGVTPDSARTVRAAGSARGSPARPPPWCAGARCRARRACAPRPAPPALTTLSLCSMRTWSTVSGRSPFGSGAVSSAPSLAAQKGMRR